MTAISTAAKQLYRGIGRIGKNKTDRTPLRPVNQKVARAFLFIDFLIAFNVILWVVGAIVFVAYSCHA